MLPNRLAAAVAVATLLGGCAPEPTLMPDGGTTIDITIGLPFQPNVQFAPFYVAQAEGFFEDEGLRATFEYGDESTFVRRVAAHDITATVASGEQVILAASQDIPVRYVMSWYQRFPVAVFATDHELGAPSDLIGLTVGLPDTAGASYLGWLALLAAADLSDAGIVTEVVGYDQVNAVAEGRVDAAVGYAVNEPIQLQARGEQVDVIEVADYFNFAANGLVVAEDSVRDSPELVAGIVRALQRGVHFTLTDPDAAFATSLTVVPEAGDPDVRTVQRTVLQESLRFWWLGAPPADASELGRVDPSVWEASRQFLIDEGIAEAEPPPVDALIDLGFTDH
jgi:NitT/TauT family transport system substrate-binding protein